MCVSTYVDVLVVEMSGVIEEVAPDAHVMSVVGRVPGFVGMEIELELSSD